MTMNRVQFQRELSMAEFLDRYSSEDKCEAALVVSRRPRGFVCPVCGASEHDMLGGSARLARQLCRKTSFRSFGVSTTRRG